MDFRELSKLAYDLRKDTVDMIVAGKGGHIGGDMSVMETLVTLYFDQMNISPENMNDPDRDLFVMSKGHSVEAYYAVLAKKGFLDIKEVNEKFSKFGTHQYKLDNLCAIVDRNRLQISGNTEDVMGHDDLHERFKSFGWHVIDVADGNSIEQLHAAFEEAKQTKGQPTVLIANTVKGKGSAVMEDKAAWHHHVPTQEEYEQIMKDFEERKEQL